MSQLGTFLPGPPGWQPIGKLAGSPGTQHPGPGRRSSVGRRIQQHRPAGARLTTQRYRTIGSSPIKECADKRILSTASDQNRRLSQSIQRG